ncbi:D-alanyl-D-alanine carboxypeptidase family protein [Cohnella algarum]|uniref:D-alanyl-D-alanine carboxypeptidase family protein n=1 Tax=Cohnella algarum TaxID=2044859 RepID=UPI001968597F|nr:D-alanyl-D-alanine carboxypeptidase family protein [Cohnella algarum]MBN2984357.1 D-alanyl-D-alanine carboxypeptidase [Cohnella algarum]
MKHAVASITRYAIIALFGGCLALVPPAFHVSRAYASSSQPHGPGAVGRPSTHAQAAALIDVRSGRLLYDHRGDEPMRIASLTKIMTAIVAIEHGDPSGVVTVSKRAAGKEGSSIYLKAGEKMKLADMLYGLMLRSGNDAAMAIAEHVGGSVEGFVFLMNRKAEELGLDRTRFANPSGLDQDGHYSTANDLAKLAAYALHNDLFREIVRTKVKTAPNPYDPWDYKWVNKNKMLFQYEGADGVKTGYTKKALRCLVSSATKNGQQLVAVTLNDRDDWLDHRNMLDYGFARYPLQRIIGKGEPFAGYPYIAMTEFAYPLAQGEREQLKAHFAPAASTSLDYAFGYRGKLIFRIGDRTIGTIGLTEASHE